MKSIYEQLQEQIDDSVSVGCSVRSLGIVDMPQGYVLMLWEHSGHYFWLKYDGTKSLTDWDRWNVYRGAKKHHKKTDPF